MPIPSGARQPIRTAGGCPEGRRAGCPESSPLLTGKPRGRPGQLLEVEFVAAHPEKAMLEAAALQVSLEPGELIGGEGVRPPMPTSLHSESG